MTILYNTNNDLYYYLANYAYLYNFSAVLGVDTNKITYSFDEGSHIHSYYLEIDEYGYLEFIQ